MSKCILDCHTLKLPEEFFSVRIENIDNRTMLSNNHFVRINTRNIQEGRNALCNL